MLRLLKSWTESDAAPDGWRSADPPGAIEKHPVKDTKVRALLKALLPGTWKKVYHKGLDGSELHYFQHESGAVAGVKHKRKGK